MKKITDSKHLAGTSEEISLSELRQNPGEVFTQVQMGKDFTITKNGRVIAEIQKPEPTALELGAEIRRLGLTSTY